MPIYSLASEIFLISSDDAFDGVGILSSKLTTISGEVPHVTWGFILEISIISSSSNLAPSSDFNSFQWLIASANISSLSLEFFLTYSIVVSSGATSPTFAPASIAILHIVILLSTEMLSIYSPANSIA